MNYPKGNQHHPVAPVGKCKSSVKGPTRLSLALYRLHSTGSFRLVDYVLAYFLLDAVCLGSCKSGIAAGTWRNSQMNVDERVVL